MKRSLLILLILALLPISVGAVDLMVSGRYVPDTKEGGLEVQAIGGIPIKGAIADHFFLVGGISADDKALDGYEGLIGFRFLNETSRFNVGLVGGIAADILNMVSGEKAVKKTYGMATGGAFITARFSDGITGLIGWEYFDPMDKENAASNRHEFGLGIVVTGLFESD